MEYVGAGSAVGLLPLPIRARPATNSAILMDQQKPRKTRPAKRQIKALSQSMRSA